MTIFLDFILQKAYRDENNKKKNVKNEVHI